MDTCVRGFSFMPEDNAANELKVCCFFTYLLLVASTNYNRFSELVGKLTEFGLGDFADSLAY